MAIVEPKFRKLRAMKMVEGKVLRNMTNKDLAQEFKCSVDTVERTLTWAKRADIFASFEDKIVQELLPLAHSAVRDALLDGNAKIGIDVLKGVNLLRPGQAAANTVQHIQDEDLAAYIATKRDRAQLQENTIDGETVLPPVYELVEGSHETTRQARVEKSVASPGGGDAASAEGKTA